MAEKYGMAKHAITEDEDEMREIFGDEAADNEDFSQPFQDYRLEIRIDRMVCGFLLKDRSAETETRTLKYFAQPISKLLKTDARLKATKME